MNMAASSGAGFRALGRKLREGAEIFGEAQETMKRRKEQEGRKTLLSETSEGLLSGSLSYGQAGSKLLGGGMVQEGLGLISAEQRGQEAGATQDIRERQANLSEDQFEFDKAFKKKQLELSAAKLNKDADGGKFKDATDLRKELKELSTSFLDTKKSFQRITDSAKSGTAAGDLALIFNYMKVLDPRSVVRESEFQTAEQARAWLTKTEESGIVIPAMVKQYIQKLETGAKLLPEQRLDFFERAADLYKGQAQIQEQANKQYEDIGTKMGIEDVTMITSPYSTATNSYDAVLQKLRKDAGQKEPVNMEEEVGKVAEKVKKTTGFDENDPKVKQALNTVNPETGKKFTINEVKTIMGY